MSLPHTNYKDFFVGRIDKKSATSWVTHIHSKILLSGKTFMSK